MITKFLTHHRLINRIGTNLSSPKIFFFTSIWLIVLLIIGTLMASQQGLYVATTQYFSAWFIFNIVPGGRMTMLIIFTNLLAKLLFASPLKWKRTGVIITHLGSLLLLCGGFITANFSTEGTMTIPEGTQSAVFIDDHKFELTLTNKHNQNFDAVIAFSNKLLKNKQILTTDEITARIEIINYYDNCDLIPQTEGTDNQRQNAISYNIKGLVPEKDSSHNQPGMTLLITGSNNTDGIYLIWYGQENEPIITVDNTNYHIALKNKQYVLPFAIELIDFQHKKHAGTSIAKSYKSIININKDDIKRRFDLYMNHPLRMDEYTFFQSSFSKTDTSETTVLAVVKNKGRYFPYFSSIIISIGLLLHMIIHLPKAIRKQAQPKQSHKTSTPNVTFKLFIYLITFASVMPQSYANSNLDNTIDISGIESIPVQDKGRLKPLDTVARNYLTLFHGKSTYNNNSATYWLINLLLSPDNGYNDKLFTIRNPDLLAALSIPVNPNHYYAFNSLYPNLIKTQSNISAIYQKEASQRDLIENQIIDIHQKCNLYYQLSRSFTPLIKDIVISNDLLAKALDLPLEEPISLFNVMQKKKKLHALFTSLKTVDEKEYTNEQRAALSLADTLSLKLNDKHSQGLAIIPPNENSDKWHTTWSLISIEVFTPVQINQLQMLESVIESIFMGDTTAFQNALTLYREALPRIDTIPLEIKYNLGDWFYNSMYLYYGACFVFLIGLLFWTTTLYRIGFFLIIFGVTLHAIGLTQRMMILGRPPVSNLYESIIFTSFSSVIFCLLIGYFSKKHILLFPAAICGALLNHIGFKYASDGDTLGMLVAVLNSNFWLGTHVITIVIGYGCTFIVGLYAHIYLIQKSFKPKQALLYETYRIIIATTMVALFFTIVGTILGGIWADQSWGRFWGWDPKENGALLIILWILMLMHGRIAGYLNDICYAIGMVLCNIVVMVAWFGVNLLNVGLHNYGFTDSNLERNLLLFAIVEILFCIIFGLTASFKKQTTDLKK